MLLCLFLLLCRWVDSRRVGNRLACAGCLGFFPFLDFYEVKSQTNRNKNADYQRPLKWLGYMQWLGKHVEQHHDACDVNSDVEFGASSHNRDRG